eukprot:c26365_g1_i1 orf=400-1947(-)
MGAGEESIQIEEHVALATLEQELEEQLVEHRASLAGLDEALGSHPDNGEFLSVREELLAAIKVAEDSLLQLKRARLLREVDALSGSSSIGSELIKTKPNVTEDSTIQSQKSTFVVGSKCCFRFSNGRWYNGQVIEFEGNGLARVSHLIPTTESMQICRYYLQQRCRFGANCRMSHGFVVPVDALKQFGQQTWQQPSIGSKVFACSSSEGLGIWKQAELESWDEALQRGNVVFIEDGSRLEVGMDALSLSEYAEVSEEEDTSSESEEDESDGDGIVDFHHASFAAIASEQNSPQTDTVTFANWERHTRGMASKMMANMGYCEGMGLGRIGQGIVTPLQVRVLPKNQSLDFINEDSQQAGNNNTSGKKKKSRGGKRKRDKKLAEAAWAAKTEEDRLPDVFDFINSQLAGQWHYTQDERSGKRIDSGELKGHKVTKAKSQKEDRRSLLAQEDEVKELKSKIEKLEEMAHRNRRDKTVYDVVSHKLDEARSALLKAEATHANASHVVHSKEKEKKWLRF